MKPESKKIEGNTNSSLRHHLRPKGTVSSSSFDLSKLSHALDLVENKPVDAIVDNANANVKQGQNGSSFDFTQLSDALRAADEEEKKRAIFNLRFSNMQDIVRAGHGLFSPSHECSSTMGDKGVGAWSFPGIPITLRLLRIVSIEKRRQHIKGRVPPRRPVAYRQIVCKRN